MKKARMSDHKQSDRTITIAWGGDVNIGRRFHYRFGTANARNALSRIKPLVEADLGIVNLECVVATSGMECVDKGERASYYFRARPEMIDTLICGGVDIVATANNHSGDYGPDALVEQGEWLDAAGIGHAGSGRTREEAFRPVFRRAGGLDVAFFALDATQKSFAAGEDTPGTAWLDPKRPQEWAEIMAPLIIEARKRADIVLVAMHWGANNLHQPDTAEIAGGHALIDAGADAVLGASAHLLQGIEIYKNRPILHDAGDLLFDALTRPDKDSGIFTLEMDHRGVTGVRFLPLEVGFCRTLPLAPEAAAEALSKFSKKCLALGTKCESTREGEAYVKLSPPRRARLPARPAPTLPTAGPISALRKARPEWLADEVPADARLAEPLRIGPMELLGLRVSPEHLNRIGLISVESWWRVPDAVDCDWRIDFRAEPAKPGPVGAWGLGCSHDPCDWMWPVSRWEPGQIYRDFYTLRPSAVRNWLDETLTLSLGLVSYLGKTERIQLPHQVRFELSPKAGFAVLRAYPAQYDVPALDTISPTPEILWTAEQLEQITGGRWLVKPPEGWFVSSVTQKFGQLESWNMKRPRLLVAVSKRMAMRHELQDMTARPDWDTHDRLAGLQHKIAGAIVARAIPGLAPDLPLLLVPDPLHALIQLGGFARRRMKGSVVVTTGSAGKTSQCLMLTQALSVDRQVVGNSQWNYNSRVGILHSLANTLPSTDVVVLETDSSSINAPGFQNLKMVQPDIAIITSISPSHLRRSGESVEDVARRKTNVIEGLSDSGVLLLNKEIDFYEYIRNKAARRGIKVMTFGQSEDADIRLLHYDQTTGHIDAVLPDGREITYQISAPGLHMAMNSLAAIGVRILLGGDLKPFLQGLAEFQPAPGRGAISKVEFKGRNLTVVDETYNANPVSMKAAISTFGNMRVEGRRILILGDMAELGADAARYHRELTPHIQEIKPDAIFLCGSLMAELQDELNAHGNATLNTHYKSVADLIPDLAGKLKSGDSILLKASNSVGMDKVFRHLSNLK
ncbi:CapA family protein [Alcaligenes faecalis]|uniref:CapA family protein n=1 Tax=Alcaligenes faecalis TaxID=511 RepID=UPI003558549F